MKVKMETGITIPNRKYYDALIKMKWRNTGKLDSFIFPESDFSSLRSVIQEVKKKHRSRKFKTVSISETERRIWRTR